MTNAPLPLQRQPQAFRNSVVPIVHVALEDELIMHCLLATAVCRVRYHDGESSWLSNALSQLRQASPLAWACDHLLPWRQHLIIAWYLMQCALIN